MQDLFCTCKVEIFFFPLTHILFWPESIRIVLLIISWEFFFFTFAPPPPHHFSSGPSLSPCLMA